VCATAVKGLPLSGKRVLVTRAGSDAARPTGAAALLREAGAEPLIVPTIELVAPADPRPLLRALADLLAGYYGWVAFTSASAVERTWDALTGAGGDAGAFVATRLAAIGPATARALEQRGLRVDVVATDFRGEGLAQAMLVELRSAGGAPRVLLPRAARARDVLPGALRAAGYPVDVVVAYETRAPSRAAIDGLVLELESGRVDAVTLTSGSTVENLCDALGARAVALLARCRVASIGPVTTEAARVRGVRVDVTAPEASVASLVRALAETYAGSPDFGGPSLETAAPKR
jgi:uroporphyrinogen-III synthase